MEGIKTWSEQCGIKELFDGEMIADALKTGNPFLRSELFLWLAENLADGM
jgi:cytoskeleton-associated protein 5